jgi:hypothetical protein
MTGTNREPRRDLGFYLLVTNSVAKSEPRQHLIGRARLIRSVIAVLLAAIAAMTVCPVNLTQVRASNTQGTASSSEDWLPPFSQLLPNREQSIVGEHLISVVLVEPFQAGEPSVTAETATTIVAQASEIWSRLSGGRVKFRQAELVEGLSARSQDRCRISMGSDLKRKTGWQSALNRHLVMIQPDNRCGFGGVATLPKDRVGNLVLLPISKDVASRDAALSLAHELGHNLGLKHSLIAMCSTALQRPCSKNREFPPKRKFYWEYGGDDLMGGSIDFGLRSLNPLQRWQLGLLDAGKMLTVDLRQRTTQTLTLVDSKGDGIQAVRLVSQDRQIAWWISFDASKQCEKDWWLEDTLCIPESSNAEVVRVHVLTRSGLSQIMAQQRTSDDMAHLVVGRTYKFPGGELNLVALGGSATINIRTSVEP